MALNKFGRNYSLTITFPVGNPLVITPPFTLEFDITRNTLTSANVCQVRIYNLSEDNRSRIRFNSFDFGIPQIQIVLLAGYGNNLATIFTGNVTQAWSVREGTNFITQMECFDGGFAFVNSTTNINVTKGTTMQTVIKTIMGDLQGVTVGSIGNSYATQIVPRNGTYSGNTVDILTQLTSGGFFVDNLKANAIGKDEYVPVLGAPIVISSKSGLLGTPIREQALIHFDMLFEPKLQVGSLILLQSITEDSYNGQYVVTSVKHKGMISAAVCGSATTTGEFVKTSGLTPATPGALIP